MLNQVSVVTERDSNRNSNATEAAASQRSRAISSTGSAQNDSWATEYNFRLYDMVSWTHGSNMVKTGINVPH